MAKTLTLASQLYQPGVQTFTINNPPPKSNGFTLTLTREGWPDGLVANISVSIRTSAQAPFLPWISNDLFGGVLTDRFGNIQTTATIIGEWPGENDGSGGRKAIAQTDVQITATVVQPIQTAVSLAFI